MTDFFVSRGDSMQKTEAMVRGRNTKATYHLLQNNTNSIFRKLMRKITTEVESLRKNNTSPSKN